MVRVWVRPLFKEGYGSGLGYASDKGDRAGIKVRVEVRV